MSTKKTASSRINPIVIVLFIFAFILVGAGTYLYMQRTKTTGNSAKTAVKPTPTPTPTKLYPDDGVKGTYNISSSQTTGPRIMKVVFDPFDVKKGQQLTMTITIINDVPVQKVTGTFAMDNTKENITFAFVSRTDKTEIWQATYPSLSDSVNYMYSLSIKAESSNGSGVGGASPRSR